MSKYAWLAIGIGAVLVFLWYRNRNESPLTLLQGGLTGTPNTFAGGGPILADSGSLRATDQKLRIENVVLKAQLGQAPVRL